MKYFSWKLLLNKLEATHQLVRINKPVSTFLEITEITDRISKNNGPALLFENTGTLFPVITNLYGSEKRMLYFLRLNNYEQFEQEIDEFFSLLSEQSKIKLLKKIPWAFKLFRTVIPIRSNRKGLWYRNRIDPVNLYALPILHCWPFDGGRYVTLPMVHTIDPITGQTNVGMYRMQVFDNKTTGMHWHPHKGGAYHYEIYKKMNQKMPVVVTIGGDPIYAYVASAPVPENINEYLLASFLRKKPVCLVKAPTSNIYIPHDVDFVLEGYIDPTEPLVLEGPFGDHTGFYSLPEPYPVFHVTNIYHRDNSIYPATIVGIPPMEDAQMGIATQKLFLPILRKTILQDIEDMYLPIEGGFHNLAIVSIRNRYPGHAAKIMNAIWSAGQMMLTKNIVVVDKEINVRNWQKVIQSLMMNCHDLRSFQSIYGPLDALDHASSIPLLGKKLGIDATSKFEHSNNTINFNSSYLQIDKFDALLKIIAQSENILAAICFVKSKDKNILKTIHESIAAQYSGMIAYVEDRCQTLDNKDLLWYMLANFNPEVDLLLVHTNRGLLAGFDCCLRSYNPLRPQPNIVTMNFETIKKVDSIWHELNLNDFISSPSLKYKKIAPFEGYLYEQ